MFGDPAQKFSVIEHLNDVGHRLPLLGETAIQSVGRIEELFRSAPIIETSDAVKLCAAQRAIEGKAPFHRQKNSINDAILIETYAELVKEKTAKGMRFVFVTHNKKDFSAANANDKLPHPDIANYFSKIKSRYSIALGETLQRVSPDLVSDLMLEQEWDQEPRRLAEILNAMDLLFHQVWYNRHKSYEQKIQRGKIKVVERQLFPEARYNEGAIQLDVWEMAKKAAIKVEKTYGLENLGPWSDFEWGMVNGKLSALRWVLGDEWDFLDT